MNAPGAAAMLERIVVAPAHGIFQPADEFRAGRAVREGDVVGLVSSLGSVHLVECCFDGVLMGTFMRPGERVRKGQALGWLRSPACA